MKLSQLLILTAISGFALSSYATALDCDNAETLDRASRGLSIEVGSVDHIIHKGNAENDQIGNLIDSVEKNEESVSERVLKVSKKIVAEIDSVILAGGLEAGGAEVENYDKFAGIKAQVEKGSVKDAKLMKSLQNGDFNLLNHLRVGMMDKFRSTCGLKTSNSK